MKESDTEGITSHCDPESCGHTGNGAPEALTGEPGRPGIEPRKLLTFPDADPLVIAGRPHGEGRVGEPSTGPAGSENRSMPGRYSSGQRDTREASRSQTGPRGELRGDKAAMNATRESDDRIVPGKEANKVPAGAGAAEPSGLPAGSHAAMEEMDHPQEPAIKGRLQKNVPAGQTMAPEGKHPSPVPVGTLMR